MYYPLIRYALHLFIMVIICPLQNINSRMTKLFDCFVHCSVFFQCLKEYLVLRYGAHHTLPTGGATQGYRVPHCPHCAQVHTCTGAHTHRCTDAQMHTQVHAWTGAHTGAYTHRCTHRCMHGQGIHRCPYTQVHMHRCTHIQVHTQVNARTDAHEEAGFHW